VSRRIVFVSIPCQSRLNFVILPECGHSAYVHTAMGVALAAMEQSVEKFMKIFKDKLTLQGRS
jgi:hypothetical protein